MIVSRTPLRVSFAGGGSDGPGWYSHGESGAVVSAAIGLYVYITASKHWDQDSLRVSYSITENVKGASHLEHSLVREALRIVGFERGVEITSVADIPGKGSGLGSSSSYAVGVLHALMELFGTKVNAEWLAGRACEIELERLRGSGGKQDQYAAAFGGINYMRFDPTGKVEVHPVPVSDQTRAALGKHFALYYLGNQRSAEKLLWKQRASLEHSRVARSDMKAMVGLASQAREAIAGGRIDELGAIVEESWQRKRNAIEVSNPDIDLLVQKALNAGSRGCKLCGAGGGGFLLVHIPEGMQECIDNALELRRVNVEFGVSGSQIVFNDEVSYVQ